mmetsp:Transcript_12282/g.19346  ORF Transcript_12282/g.19346 Transcript_12282/m.19346 type:complete len:94 (+) Transcript_12282:414-695(+)
MLWNFFWHSKWQCYDRKLGCQSLTKHCTLSGAAEAQAIALLMAACPHLGAAAGGAVLAKKMYHAGAHTKGAYSTKSKPFRKAEIKRAALAVIA